MRSIRASVDHIEIDENKNRYPYIRFQKLKGGKLLIEIDAHHEPQFGTNEPNLATLTIGRKKARALAAWLLLNYEDE